MTATADDEDKPLLDYRSPYCRNTVSPIMMLCSNFCMDSHPTSANNLPEVGVTFLDLAGGGAEEDRKKMKKVST